MQTTTRYDLGDGVLPAWLPAPADCALTPKPTYYNHPAERTGCFEIASARAAAEFYGSLRAAIVGAGFDVDLDAEMPFPAGEAVGLGMFTATSGARSVSVLISKQAGERLTLGTLSYEETLAVEAG